MRRCAAPARWRPLRSSRRASRGPLLLAIDQLALALDPPAIAGEAAVVADDAVARYRDRVGVGRASPGHGANRSRRADLLGNARVRLGLAGRDLAKRQPDALLEGRAAHVQRQGQAVGRRLD